jgi:hypothetical protein
VFGTFLIPGGGSVTVTFTATIAPSVAPGAYQNTGTDTYADPQRTSPTGTLSVASAPATVNVTPNNPTQATTPTPATPSVGMGLLANVALALSLLLGGAGLLLLSPRWRRGDRVAGRHPSP